MLLGRLVTAAGIALMVHAGVSYIQYENLVAERYGLDIEVDAPIDVIVEVVLSLMVTFAGAMLSVGGFQNARATRGRMLGYDEMLDTSDLLPPTSREVALARLRRLYGGDDADQRIGSGEKFGEMGAFGPASQWGRVDGANLSRAAVLGVSEGEGEEEEEEQEGSSLYGPSGGSVEGDDQAYGSRPQAAAGDSADDGESEEEQGEGEEGEGAEDAGDPFGVE